MIQTLNSVIRFYTICLVSVLILSTSCAAEKCEDCWEPKLNFDIEGKGFMGSMIFISGQSYALSISNEELASKGKENFFCKEGSVGSKELIDILNQKLKGVVSAEEVTEQIVLGLKASYPCN